MKKLFALLTAAGTYLTLAQYTFAQIDAKPQAGSGFEKLSGFTLTGSFISAVVTLLFIVAIVLALIYLIWGGIKWITSGGDKMALQQAREHVIAAVVGLILVLASYFIISFVLGVFGFSGDTDIGKFLFNIPTFTNP